MKRIFFIASAILIALCSHANGAEKVLYVDARAAEKSSPVVNAGRFMIFQGEYDNTNITENKTQRVNDLLKIDTTSGKVWRAVSVTVRQNGKLVNKRYWEPFEKDDESVELTTKKK